jgi:hypothetical protein
MKPATKVGQFDLDMERGWLDNLNGNHESLYIYIYIYISLFAPFLVSAFFGTPCFSFYRSRFLLISCASGYDLTYM